MELIDLASLPPGMHWEADLCIIGTGPAGLTIARELAGTSLQILLVESGGLSTNAEADALNVIESIGAPREMDQTLVRNRIFGGTSTTWTGRAAFFDEIDFEKRDWVPHSGWPIAIDEVRRFLPRTTSHLGIGLEDNTDIEAIWRRIRSQTYRMHYDSSLLREYFWHYSQDAANPLNWMRFGPRALREDAPNVRCLINATATHINTDPDGRVVTGVEITSLSNRRSLVTARATVLCAGAIENARLLLASNRIVRDGVGNGRGLVGRFLMDHPRGAIGEFDDTRDKSFQQRFGLYRAVIGRTAYALTYGAALSPDLQRRERLLNSAVWISDVRAEDDPWDSVAAILRRRGNTGRHLKNIAANTDLLFEGLWRRFVHHRGVPHKVTSINLQCIVEQTPNPESRVMLADRVDALGVPISRIDWRIGEQESRTVRRMAQVFCDQLARAGLPQPRLYEMAKMDSTAPLTLPDVAHPIGTTRMSEDATSGVVDRNGAVHGVAKLFVAGSSVFPTSAHANPTHMIVALSVRLSDHLKTILQQADGQRPALALEPAAVGIKAS